MKRIRVTALDHIVLNVEDIDRSLQFYTGVLGLHGERINEFKAGNVGFPSVRINAETIIDLFPSTQTNAAARDERGKRNGNLNHFCLVVAPEDFIGIVDYLKENGVTVREGPISRWGARGRAMSVYFLDPDGNEIEIRRY